MRSDAGRRLVLRGLAIGAMPIPYPAVAAAFTPAAQSDSVMTQHSAKSRLATRSVMLDITSAGERWVAVGERGRVLLSDDAGVTWRQAAGVPTSVSLTAARFVDARTGWAIGHAGMVLKTLDGGETWRVQLTGIDAARLAMEAAQAAPVSESNLRAARQLVADGADKPLLALHVVDSMHVFIVGAYGLAVSTQDGGESWRSRMRDLQNPAGLHLYAIHQAGARVFVVGEKGLILRSRDGDEFEAVKSPYDGSWFAMGSLPDGALLVSGLRGNAYVTDNGGESWAKVDIPAPVTLNYVGRLTGGDLSLLNQAGAMFRIGADRRAVSVALPPSAPLTAIAQADDGALVASSYRGPIRIPGAIR